jgi:hypothetical protein
MYKSGKAKQNRKEELIKPQKSKKSSKPKQKLKIAQNQHPLEIKSP